MNLSGCLIAGVCLFFTQSFSQAEVSVTIEHQRTEDAGVGFKRVPPPSRTDVATSARFSIVYGTADGNSGELSVLHDGRASREEDDPGANFFFRDSTAGGGLLVDLGRLHEVKQVNTYSWHPNTRAPQVYKLYASDGTAENFSKRLSDDSEAGKFGWKSIAAVDTRPEKGDPGGQYGVTVADTAGALGKYRFFLFALSRTESADAFGNTFLSEIDVVSLNPAGGEETNQQPVAAVDRIEVEGGYEIVLDTSDTPDLAEWARKELIPMAKEWYPKIVGLLPSEGYQAPKKLSIVFSEEMRGVAATSGTRIRCAGGWFRRNLKGEAVGAVFHELVHVVQQYGQARRSNPNATRPPGWLTEGIPDYLRWFIYEPQTRGAEITRRNIARARYDASYRITANFLNWVTEKYARDLVKTLNAAIREGKYEEELWKQTTRHSLTELGEAWKQEMETKVGAEP